MKSILFLSQTDINSDSRILKYIHCAEKKGFKIACFGVKNAYHGLEAKKNLPTQKLLNIAFLQKAPRHLRNLLVPIIYFFYFIIPSLKLKPNIIHCNDASPLLLAIACKKLCKSFLIYDAHELESDKNGISPWLSKGVLLIEKIAWKKIDYFVTVSESIKKWYLKKFGYKESQVIYNSPISKINKKQTKNYLKNKFCLPEKAKIFIYCGVIGMGRGLIPFFKYFLNTKCKHYLILLGYWEKMFHKQYSKKIKNSSNIFFHPAVKHEEVCGITAAADFGLCLIEKVSLSDYFCMPNKLFEYAFSGLKIIGSNFPEIKKFLHETKTGFCFKEKEKPSKIIKKIIKNKQNPNFNKLRAYSFSEQSKKISLLYDCIKN